MGEIMRNNNKILLRITIAITLLIISNLLVGNQRDNEVFLDEKDINEDFGPSLPRESSVYYENTTDYAIDIYVSGDYAYVADQNSGLAVIDITDPKNPRLPVYDLNFYFIQKY